MTHDGATKMDLHKDIGKSPHIYSKVRGAPLIFTLITSYTTSKSYTKQREERKISFGNGKLS